MCTAVEETNIELILAVMNTTELVVEIRSYFSGLISTTSSVVFTTARIDSILVYCKCFSKRIPKFVARTHLYIDFHTDFHINIPTS